MELSRQLDKMNAAELRNLTATLIAQLAERDAERSAQTALIAKRDAEIKAKQLKIDQLTHEMATLKRWRYDRRSEQLDVLQRSLLDESIDADIEAISIEIEALKEKPASPPKEKPRRVALPASFPRREIRHEPETTQCNCGCSLERIGEDVSEKLDYTPGVFEVERHIRGKCLSCLRAVAPGAGAAPRHRQGDPDGGPAGAGADRKILGSRTAVPAGKHLRTCRPCAAALDPGAVGGRLRREATAACRGDESDAPDSTGAACR